MTQFDRKSGWVAALVLLSLWPLNSAAWADSYQSTCQYFTNQAFQDRHQGTAATFRMQLAQDCVDARLYARSENIEVKRRAEAYLDLLEEYRRTIAALMIERMRNPAARASSGSTRRYVRPAYAAVSWTGAYLIARDMGLIETHRNWTDWRRAHAFADARFRIEN